MACAHVQGPWPKGVCACGLPQVTNTRLGAGCPQKREGLQCDMRRSEICWINRFLGAQRRYSHAGRWPLAAVVRPALLTELGLYRARRATMLRSSKVHSVSKEVRRAGLRQRYRCLAMMAASGLRSYKRRSHIISPTRKISAPRLSGKSNFKVRSRELTLPSIIDLAAQPPATGPQRPRSSRIPRLSTLPSSN